jgi:hypothetical protein
MSKQTVKGISRKGLDEAFKQEEIRKSNLLLEAQLLRAQQKDEDVVAAKFAEAASLEEQLGELCAKKGLREKFFVHQFSAANCWAEAGNFYRALMLCEELLKQSDLPAKLHQRIQQRSLTFRTSRTWFHEKIAKTHETAMAA